MSNIPKFQSKDSISKLDKTRIKILAPSQSAVNIKGASKLSNDIRLQNLKERIIGQDFFVNFGSRPVSSKIPKEINRRISSKRVILREHIHSHSRPISPILKSNNLMRNAMEYHQPISHLLVPKRTQNKKK